MIWNETISMKYNKRKKFSLFSFQIARCNCTRLLVLDDIYFPMNFSKNSSVFLNNRRRTNIHLFRQIREVNRSKNLQENTKCSQTFRFVLHTMICQAYNVIRSLEKKTQSSHESKLLYLTNILHMCAISIFFFSSCTFLKLILNFLFFFLNLASSFPTVDIQMSLKYLLYAYQELCL